MSYKIINDNKKVIEKMKKCCREIIKYNLNSPCLLQFLRNEIGEYEIIISHDPSNNTKMNFYKIFESVLYKEINKSEEIEKEILGTDERTSVPIIVSTIELDELLKNKNNKYGISVNSFYIFPKLLLKAVRNDVILGIETENIGFEFKTFSTNILFDLDKLEEKEIYGDLLFISNSQRLDYIFGLSVFPLVFSGGVNKLFNYYINEINRKNILESIYLNKEEVENLFKINKYDNYYVPQNNTMKIFHHDFIPNKCEYSFIYKIFENLLEMKRNIVTIYMKNKEKDLVIYLKYKYYDMTI